MVEPSRLSRRERQIMDILYRLGSASAKDVRENLADPPSNSTVRTLLQQLLNKGHVTYKESGLKYVYFPTVARSKASQSAIDNLVTTFFSDSPYLAVNSLIDMAASELSEEELSNLEKLIKQKQQSKKKTGA
ncbi:MAG: BlaI/MecI/CopY family transcriptional regulator [Pseudomonadales bacterium]